MCRRLWIVLMAVVLLGCAKGDKGDTGPAGLKGDTGLPGTSTLLSSKTYTGTPTANPHNVYCAEITDISRQVVECYEVDSSGWHYILPSSNEFWSDDAAVNPTSRYVSFFTSYNSSYGYQPTIALKFPSGTQCTYKIIIKTFSTASAAQAYKSSMKPSTLQSIIHGDY